ncbi:hypothetical protein [Streptomyces sp. NPDC091209]|uniref:hypothetical protein n=1 Tax=Streptomyces sp. NPDC091209 TaxID=3365974 RepID=UPI0038192673
MANQHAVLHLRIRRFFCDIGTCDHEDNTGPDTDNVQQGDQKAPDHGTNGEG